MKDRNCTLVGSATIFSAMQTKVPLTYLIYQAVRAIQLQLSNALSENGFPITIEQWPILNEIFFNGGITQQDLANRVRKDKTTLTRILNTLEKNRLIERRASTVDKRKKQLYHTAKAEEMRLGMIEVLKDQGEFILDGLDEKEQEAMRHGLNVIFRNLKWEFNFLDTNYSFK